MSAPSAHYLTQKHRPTQMTLLWRRKQRVPTKPYHTQTSLRSPKYVSSDTITRAPHYHMQAKPVFESQPTFGRWACANKWLLAGCWWTGAAVGGVDLRGEGDNSCLSGSWGFISSQEFPLGLIKVLANWIKTINCLFFFKGIVSHSGKYESLLSFGELDDNIDSVPISCL